MRYLAIDLGDKRTGLAVGDSITRLVSPAGTIEVPVSDNAGKALLDALSTAIQEHLGPATNPSRAALVVGLPLNMDDSEGPRARQVREFAARLATQSGHTILFQDERLSTAQADWDMARSGLTRGQKKGRRDALAAAAILSDFLAALGPSTPESR